MRAESTQHPFSFLLSNLILSIPPCYPFYSYSLSFLPPFSFLLSNLILSIPPSYSFLFLFPCLPSTILILLSNFIPCLFQSLQLPKFPFHSLLFTFLVIHQQVPIGPTQKKPYTLQPLPPPKKNNTDWRIRAKANIPFYVFWSYHFTVYMAYVK